MAARRTYVRWTKPEAALKRAEDLLALDQKSKALDALAAVVSRRHKTWEKSLELVVMKLLEVAIEMRRSRRAKDAMHQYRSATTLHPQSLETVLRHFVRLSENAANNAKQRVELQLRESNAEVPQKSSTIISTVAGESLASRLEREYLSPWLRLLMDTYRTTLELIRFNPRFEALYLDTVRSAFESFVKYDRKTDFKHMCEHLRAHLGNMSKYFPNYYDSQDNVNYQLTIRFIQLDTAVKLEMWQEAFRTVEEIKNNILIHSRTTVSRELLSQYYDQLSKLFWVSRNYYFHALAIHRLIEVQQDYPQDDQDSQSNSQLIYSKLLLASLCVNLVSPLGETFSVGHSIETEKQLRLGALLDLDQDPQRHTLLSQLESENVPRLCYPEVQALYSALESDFRPLQFGKEQARLLEFISAQPELQVYVSRLQEIGFQKLLQKLARVYSTMELSRLSKLMLPQVVEPLRLEQDLISAISQRIVVGYVDHLNGVLVFESEDLESQEMRSKLADIGKNLRLCVDMIRSSGDADDKAKKRLQYMRTLISRADQERSELAHRRQLLDDMKVIREQQQNDAAAAAAERERQQQEARAAEDKARQLAKDDETRSQQQLVAKKAAEQKKKEAIAQKLQEMVDKTTGPATTSKSKKSKKLLKEIEEKDMIDSDAFVKEQVQRLYKERKRAEQAITSASTRMDHHIRAERELEAPYVKAYAESRLALLRAAAEKQNAERLEQYQKRLEETKEIRERLARLSAPREEFEAKTSSSRQQRFDSRQQERAAAVAAWRTKREAELIAAKEEQEREFEERQRREREREREEEERRLAYASEAASPPQTNNWRNPGGERAWRQSPGGSAAAAAPPTSGNFKGSSPSWRGAGGTDRPSRPESERRSEHDRGGNQERVQWRGGGADRQLEPERQNWRTPSEERTGSWRPQTERPSTGERWRPPTSTERQSSDSSGSWRPPRRQ